MLCEMMTPKRDAFRRGTELEMQNKGLQFTVAHNFIYDKSINGLGQRERDLRMMLEKPSFALFLGCLH